MALESMGTVNHRLPYRCKSWKREKRFPCNPSCALKTKVSVCVCVSVLCVCVINRAEHRPRNVTQVVRNMVWVTSPLSHLHQEILLTFFPLSHIVLLIQLTATCREQNESYLISKQCPLVEI